MAIPTTPLEINFDPDRMTLGDNELLRSEGRTGESIPEQMEFTHLFAEFLIQHSNWSRDEVHRITFTELQEVARQIGAAMQARAVPLASRLDSNVGRAESLAEFPTGSAS
jgi:hypothetical protein